MYAKRQKGWEKHFDFMMLDIVSIFVAFLTGYIARHGIQSEMAMSAIYWRVLVVLVILHLCVVFFRESYKSIVRRGYLTELKNTVSHCVTVDALLLMYLFLLQQTSIYSRESIIVYFVLQLGLTYMLRCLHKHIIRVHMLNNPNVEQMLVIVDADVAGACVAELAEDMYRNYRVTGVILLNESKQKEQANVQQAVATLETPADIDGVPVVCAYDELPNYLMNHVIDSVFIYADMSEEKRRHLTYMFVKSGVTVHISLVRLPHDLPNRTVERIGNYTVLTSGMRLATKRQLVNKRLLDMLGGVVGSLITIVAMVIFGPIIFIQSPGPIFFSQERVGKNGRKFRIYKFRSMYMDAEARKAELMKHNKMDGLMFKMDNDPRIIPIGKFIRKFSIDELPQFFNVLKGDMSLVGTRPPTVDEFEQYHLHHRGRLGSKPGITGRWQVSGRSDITDFEEVVSLDTEYIMNWSVSEDIRILWKTVKMVIRGAGAE